MTDFNHDPAIIDHDIYETGIQVGIYDLHKTEAEDLAVRLSKETGIKHDWHYFAGRVVMKRALTDEERQAKIDQLMKKGPQA